MKNITILGSTGSIGTQALEVVRAHPDKCKVFALTAQSNISLLIEQAIEFQPTVVVISNEKFADELKSALKKYPIEVLCGEEALSQVVTATETNLILTALVGFVGLKPTIAAIEAGKNIALANKETLVVAGELVMELAKKKGVEIFPVDSEHSAIFQCLVGEQHQSIEKLILTASGGPFRGKQTHELKEVTLQQALKHPNWNMGAKITIDSATLMNKGLEVIEAKWLFDVPVDAIEVVVHPQSIIHSLVQFSDGSIKAQLGLPDMKLPIHYAIHFPERVATSFERFEFTKYPNLTFEKPDLETFKNLSLAFQAIREGGNMPCILNAANEVVVAAFLQQKIGFLEMSQVIEDCMSHQDLFESRPDFVTYLETDRLTRIFAQNLIAKYN